MGQQAASLDLSVYDWKRDTSRLTFAAQTSRLPLWSPDGKYIVFALSNLVGLVRANGAGGTPKLLKRGFREFCVNVLRRK
jgi:Tol biopolymer transport system component